jgi:hypothetical protein
MIIPWEKVACEIIFTWVKSTMTMSIKMWISYDISTIWLERWHWKNMSCSRKTWNPTSLTMEVKEFQTTSCMVVRFAPWAQWNMCILNKSMGWLDMHKKKPQIIGWGKPNLLCSVKEKMLKSIGKDGMCGQVDSWAPKPRPMQDFNQTWWQL